MFRTTLFAAVLALVGLWTAQATADGPANGHVSQAFSHGAPQVEYQNVRWGHGHHGYHGYHGHHYGHYGRYHDFYRPYYRAPIVVAPPVYPYYYGRPVYQPQPGFYYRGPGVSVGVGF